MQSFLNRVLVCIAALIFVLILFVTALSFALKKAKPGKNIRVPDPLPGAISHSATNSEKLAAFVGLGRIRAVTKPHADNIEDIGTPLVIAPWFSYPENDSAFYEELALKSTMMRAIITQYFASYTERELLKMGEEKIKADLLTQINEHLSLNKIESLYFSDYIFLE